MATKTITIRPTSDIILGHTPSNGSVGYSMISEATADDDSTYIDDGNTASTTYTSKFGLPCSIPSGAKITSVIAYIRIKPINPQSTLTATVTSSFEFVHSGGTTSISQTTNDSIIGNSNSETEIYITYSTIFNSTSLNQLNSYQNITEFHYNIATTTSQTQGVGGNKNPQRCRITQIYMVITYEESTPIYLKQNGVWTTLSGTIYQKQNGVWVATDASALNDVNKYIIAPEIKFTVSNVEYTAINGMTWQQWVDSEYNTKGATINSSTGEIVWTKSLQIYVYTGDQLSDRRVLATEKIIENHAYHTTAVLPI